MFDKSREIQFDELILLEHIWAESVHFINIELKIIGFFFTIVAQIRDLASLFVKNVFSRKVEFWPCVIEHLLQYGFRSQWILINSIMKLLFVLIYLSLISEQSHGFRLPSPLDYYNYHTKIKTTTQKPISTTSSQDEHHPKDIQLRRILKEWLIRNREFIHKGLPTYFKLQKYIDPSMPPPTKLRLSRLMSRLIF